MLRPLCVVLLLGSCAIAFDPGGSSPPTEVVFLDKAPSLGPSTRFVDSVLGIAIEYWQPWRPSSCLSSRADGLGGQDTFVLLTEEQERGISFRDTPPPLGWTISAHVQENPRRLRSRAWLNDNRVSGKFDDVRLGERDLVRIRDGIFGSLAYLLISGDRAFVVGLVPGEGATPPISGEDYVTAMAATLEPLAPVVPATPSASLRAAQGVADTLGDAFARRDGDRLGELIVPTCWFMTTVGNTATGVHPAAFLADVRSRLARGLVVTLKPRALQGDSMRPPVIVPGTWAEDGRSREVTLTLWPQNGRWYWTGVAYDRP